MFFKCPILEQLPVDEFNPWCCMWIAWKKDLIHMYFLSRYFWGFVPECFKKDENDTVGNDTVALVLLPWSCFVSCYRWVIHVCRKLFYLLGDLNLFSPSGNCVKCEHGSFINDMKACQQCPASRFFCFVQEKQLLSLFKVQSCLWKKISSAERGWSIADFYMSLWI